MSEKARGRGRPKQENTASERCEFRVNPERKEKYKEHAASKGLKLGAWLKSLADKDAGLESD